MNRSKLTALTLVAVGVMVAAQVAGAVFDVASLRGSDRPPAAQLLDPLFWIAAVAFAFLLGARAGGRREH